MKTRRQELLFALIILIQSGCLFVHGFSVTPEFFTKRDWKNITNVFTSFPTKGFLNDTEVFNYLKDLGDVFPEIVSKLEKIGETYEKRDIYTVQLSYKKQSVVSLMAEKQKPKVLFTSFLKGTDFISTAMSIHLINYIIYGYVHKNPEVLYLLENRDVWIIPILNVDAYNLVSNFIAEKNQTVLITKNRRNNDPDDICGYHGIGVDLNRNFDANFYEPENIMGVSNKAVIESANYICKPFYKGLKPFSESETRALRDFLEKKSFQVGLNLFGMGPVFLMPYSSSSEAEGSNLERNDVYTSILEEYPFPNGTKIGTKFQIFGETQNGEISDYMLKKKGIIAGSYYLGLAQKGFESSFPIQSKLNMILEENMNSLLYFIQKAGVNIKIEEKSQGRCQKEISECKESTSSSYYFRFKISNTGLEDYNPNVVLHFSFKYQEIYNLQRIILLTSDDKRELLDTDSTHRNNQTFYEIETPFLPQGKYYFLSLVFVRISSSFLGQYIPVPSNNPQSISLQVKDFPMNKYTKYEGEIQDPNFDITDYNEMINFRNGILKIVFSVFLSFGVLFAMGLLLFRCFRKNGEVKFAKLEEAADSDLSTTIDPESQFTAISKKKEVRKEIELSGRVGRSKTKRNSEKKSKSRTPKEESVEKSDSAKKELSKERKKKEKRKTSTEKGVKKRRERSKDQREKNCERTDQSLERNPRRKNE